MSVDLPTLGRPNKVTKPHLIVWALSISSLFILSCLGNPDTEVVTTDFDRAESFFRQGIYERALDDYERFIERHPESPLADTARLRIRTIKREVSSMLENPKLKGAKYHGRERAEESKALELLDLIEAERAAEADKRK